MDSALTIGGAVAITAFLLGILRFVWNVNQAHLKTVKETAEKEAARQKELNELTQAIRDEARTYTDLSKRECEGEMEKIKSIHRADMESIYTRLNETMTFDHAEKHMDKMEKVIDKLAGNVEAQTKASESRWMQTNNRLDQLLSAFAPVAAKSAVVTGQVKKANAVLLSLF